MQTLEQSLCAASETPMVALVERGETAWGVEEFSFAVRLDDESRLSCFSAQYMRGSALPTLMISLDAGGSERQAKERDGFFSRVVSRGKYLLIRSSSKVLTARPRRCTHVRPGSPLPIAASSSQERAPSTYRPKLRAAALDTSPHPLKAKGGVATALARTINGGGVHEDELGAVLFSQHFRGE